MQIPTVSFDRFSLIDVAIQVPFAEEAQLSKKKLPPVIISAVIHLRKSNLFVFVDPQHSKLIA